MTSRPPELPDPGNVQNNKSGSLAEVDEEQDRISVQTAAEYT